VSVRYSGAVRVAAAVTGVLVGCAACASAGGAQPATTPEGEDGSRALVDEIGVFAQDFLDVWNRSTVDPAADPSIVDAVAGEAIAEMMKRRMRDKIENGMRASGSLVVVGSTIGDITVSDGHAAATVDLCLDTTGLKFVDTEGHPLPPKQTVRDRARMLLAVENPAFPNTATWRVHDVDGGLTEPCTSA